MSDNQNDRGPYLQEFDNPYSELGPIDTTQNRDNEKFESAFFEPYQEGEQQEANDEATENALNQLFNPVSDHDLQLDPTLASSIDAQHPNEAHEAAQVDHAPDLDQGVEQEGETETRAKRKASSRADMLTRGGACDFCKRRKLKCSAELPSCAACRRSGKECIYSQKKQRSKVKLLEERLVELERKLGQQPSPTGAETSEQGGNQNQHLDSEGVVFADSVDTTILETPSYHYGVPHINSTFNLPEYEVDHNPTEPELVVDKVHEPDLMTLADAAAGRNWPWEGMAPEVIARELVAAVEGGKGLGDKIISHLLSVYRNAGKLFFLSDLIPAETLVARMNGRLKPRPQPSLLLSVIAWLLPLSPSPDLSSPARYQLINSIIQLPARSHSMQAMSAPDGRLLDSAIGDALRAMTCYRQARFLEGWGEGARAAALAWAAGLGKLGGIGESFAGGGVERAERVEKERRYRSLAHKGQVIEPAKDAAELGNRIIIFWNLFGQDQCAAIGWGWPSNFVSEEVTTPFPKDNYEDPAALRDNTTLNDFFDLTTTLPPGDSDLCSLVKSQSLCYRACRLFDQSPSIATRESTSHLLAVAERHRTSLRDIPSNPANLTEVAIQHGQLSQAWMCLYAGIAHLHAKDALDSTQGDDDLPQAKCIAALGKVVEYLHYSYEGGDMELEGMTICSQTIWFVVASLAYRLHRRLIALPNASDYSEAISETKRIGDELVQACRICAKKDNYGATTAQLLENIAMGQDSKMGEWERPDNLARG